MKNNFFLTILVLALVPLLFSCKKTIELDLQPGAQLVVIDGEITNAPPPYLIQVYRSGSFSDLSVLPAISDALVIVSDDMGIIDTLKHSGNGKYYTKKIIGKEGHTYYLKININDTLYTAQSTMPFKVSLDSVKIERSQGFGGPENKNITPKYLDPPGLKNYYQFRLYSNDSLKLSNVLFDDQLTDGKENTRPFFSKLYPGAKARIEMRGYDMEAYTYQFGISQIQQNGRNQSASPANPTNNITGGNTLGFFSANTLEEKTYLIDP
jgi:hypothetical protein